MGRFIANKSIVDALSLHKGFSTSVTYLESLSPNKFCSASIPLVFCPDPNLSQLSHYRDISNPTDVSFVGLTHTLSTPGALKIIDNINSQTVYPWDALICTSSCAEKSIRSRVPSSSDLHSAPFITTIPLGVDLDEFNYNCSRESARRSLNIDCNSFVLLWIGRLEQHCKSNHIPYFQALDIASKRYPDKSITFIAYGTSSMPSIPDALRSAANAISPDINFLLFDGKNVGLRSLLVAASDVFISLPDSFQETFGLTPVEAMASGLPVIGSDWNGYKDTIIDGLNGFRIPTFASREFFDSNNSFEEDTTYFSKLDEVSYLCSNQISISLPRLVDVLSFFLSSPTLALIMGHKSRKFVESMYDWPVIMKRYEHLFDELSSIRSFYSGKKYVRPKISAPVKYSYYSRFHSWPTDCSSTDTLYVLNESLSNLSLNEFLDLELIRTYASIMPCTALISHLYQTFKRSGPISFQAACESSLILGPIPFHQVSRALGFLLKYSFVRVL